MSSGKHTAHSTQRRANSTQHTTLSTHGQHSSHDDTAELRKAPAEKPILKMRVFRLTEPRAHPWERRDSNCEPLAHRGVRDGIYHKCHLTRKSLSTACTTKRLECRCTVWLLPLLPLLLLLLLIFAAAAAAVAAADLCCSQYTNKLARDPSREHGTVSIDG